MREEDSKLQGGAVGAGARGGSTVCRARPPFVGLSPPPSPPLPWALPCSAATRSTTTRQSGHHLVYYYPDVWTFFFLASYVPFSLTLQFLSFFFLQKKVEYQFDLLLSFFLSFLFYNIAVLIFNQHNWVRPVKRISINQLNLSWLHATVRVKILRTAQVKFSWIYIFFLF